MFAAAAALALPDAGAPYASALAWALRDPAGRVLLEQRPPSGIWGGLWSLPEVADLRDALPREAVLLREDMRRELAQRMLQRVAAQR